LPFRRNPNRDAAELAYSSIVEQARRPEFFTTLGVPDTLDGRFELICLHAFLYLHRLKAEGSVAAALGQLFVDRMFADFDRSLREIGTGDLSVGRQIKRMAEAFYGRIRAYEDGLAGGDEGLGAALARNLYGTATATQEQLERLASYLRREDTSLAKQAAVTLRSGAIAFGVP
jgi:cytochrome b pre-mRNA-processing protein 3